MSTTFSFAGKEITIYCGTPVFIAGVIGGLLNTIVFLSLRTFRQSSCAFYFTIMSIFNVLVLVFGLLPPVLSALTGVDGTTISLVYCKLRIYIQVVSLLTSMTCFCLATIDQYFATCSRPRWRQFCNIKLAHRIIIISVIIWMIHGIPYLFFYNHFLSPTTNKITCMNTNYIFEQYRTFFVVLVLIGYLPIVIAGLFGLMAYRNVQQIAYRTVPLVRRHLDKQLTVMALVQVVVNSFTVLIFTTVNAVSQNKNLTADPIIQAKVQFAITVTLIFSYVTFASPFYNYICTSARFRRQLIHVLFTIHFNRCKRPRMVINQVTPET